MVVILSWPVVSGAVALVSTLLVSQLGTTKFLPGSCLRLEKYLEANLVGQELATQQLVTAVCAHLDEATHHKPLIISVHGPPGVGKSFTHMLMARALYNKHPEVVTNCPGASCAGYKVIYGLHFPEATRQEQLAAIKQDILAHIKGVRDPLLVFEEYDKYDCETRTWLRHLLDHTDDVDSSGALSRAIILLESNVGYTLLEQMLTEAQGDASKLTFEVLEQALKNELFASWQPSVTGSGSQSSSSPHVCEEPFVDTLRFTSMVDLFLPYLPLQRRHVEAVANITMQHMADRLREKKGVGMQWDDQVLRFLSSKVEFDGMYPPEGAKQVATVVSRYVSPAVRKCPTFVGWAPTLLDSQHKDSAAQHSLKFSVKDNQMLVDYPPQPG